ncbi:unnamed protein product, partial [marine sediment metagenome]
REAIELMAKYHISGIPIVNKEKRLVGILTNRDIRFLEEEDKRLKIAEIMTKENLITAPLGTTLEEAKKILHKNRIEKLPIVNKNFILKGLITIKDIEKVEKFPNACKDAKGRLRVGAAVGVSRDTMERVEALVTEGPKCVEELIELGTKFDKIEGKYKTALEAAHQRPRILRARGDATGAEIEDSLSEKVINENKIKIKENVLVIDILTEHTTCYGLLALDSNTNEIIAYLARATILASGGAGQLFSNTTNPDVATGDGIAMAYRGGAKVTDLEFIQFHPTALYHQGSPKFLIS